MSSNQERKYFTFQESFYKDILRIPEECRADAYTAVMEYGLYGNEVEVYGEARRVFEKAREVIDKKNSGRKAKSKEVYHEYGEYHWVKLTDKQYKRLVDKYGEEVVKKCIEKVDVNVEKKGNSQGYRRWSVVVEEYAKKGWYLDLSERKNNKPRSSKDDLFYNPEEHKGTYDVQLPDEIIEKILGGNEND